MDDLTLTLLVIAATAMLVVVIFLLVRRHQAQTEQALIQFAAENGLKYEKMSAPLASGFRLDGPGWNLESVSRSSGQSSGQTGSSNIRLDTLWHTDLPGRTLLIGERMSNADPGGFGEMLMRQVLQMALGSEADGLQQVQIGSTEFCHKYIVFAKSPEAFRPGPAFENALLNWRGQKPLIRRSVDGLDIEIRGARLQKPDELLQLINLGKILQTLLRDS
jgi:hypothetical protein